MNTPNKQLLIEILNKNYLNSKKLIETSLNNKIKVLLENTQAPQKRTGYQKTGDGNIKVTEKTVKSHYADPLLKSPWHWLNPFAVPFKVLDLLPADDKFNWYNPVDLIKAVERKIGLRHAGTQTTTTYEIPGFNPRSHNPRSNKNQKNQDMGPISSRVVDPNTGKKSEDWSGWRQRGSKKTVFADDININEEIVNPKNKGTMSKSELGSRDRLAKKVKADPIKGKDTKENAKYRLATYITIKNRKGDK
ncbi:hypothetical protein FJ364_04140 [Candidatus Dependentiae bacterium]|nr:hypothetical protein [Candidatus Dependentiae bacterium]